MIGTYYVKTYLLYVKGEEKLGKITPSWIRSVHAILVRGIQLKRKGVSRDGEVSDSTCHLGTGVHHPAFPH